MHAHRILFLSTCLACRLGAQQLAAPTPEQTGPARGEDWQDYNITDTFETGYRFDSVSGNRDSYQSNVNFGNGIRLLNGMFTMDSKNGRGGWFDQIVVNASGLGNDPYENAGLRVQKNRIYDYRMDWRRNEYFNPGLITDGGEGGHLLMTTHTQQNHDLTLFPQSNVRLFLGYTEDRDGGAGISTVQGLDSSGDVVPLYTNVNWVRNEYRLGAEGHWYGFVLNVMHGWEDFKDDTTNQSNAAAPIGPGPNSDFLTTILRNAPDHGTAPYWRVFLFRSVGWLRLNGRLTYTSGDHAFLLDESGLATSAVAPSLTRQIFTFGNARRLAATGNVSMSILATRKVTISENASLYNVRTEGDSAYLEIDNAAQGGALLNFQSLGIRTFASDSTISYEAVPWLSMVGAYQYSDRRITSVEQFAPGNSAAVDPDQQTNILNSGSLGVRLRPLRNLTIGLEGEAGHSNLPFTPKSDGNFTATDARIQYRVKQFRFSAASKTDYNATSVALSAYSSHSRTYSTGLSWTASHWIDLDASYAKLHLDTVGGIAFFADNQFFPSETSYYISNLHTANLGIRLSITKRADVYLGYSRVQDTGDGRASGADTFIGPPIPGFQAAQAFPLTYQSPLARVSIHITPKLRWNAGYQYFGYHADFSTSEDYLANTGYTSLTWSF